LGIAPSNACDARRGRRLGDRFAKAAELCGNPRQLRALLADAALELGFHFFALLDHASISGGAAGLIRLDNYPEHWVEELLELGRPGQDPVHVASRRTKRGFDWGELDSLVRLERHHPHIRERARYHGLGNGFTVPANVPGEPSASCTFAVRAGRDLPTARLRCAELVGGHALRAARRLRAPATPLQRPRLSRREIECLRLVALGKTDWEISRILGLSRHTARQYVKRLRAAYDTVSRARLVAYGLRDSWISLDEAIPPNGGM
jgi:DNA-binding CsgD family transcriptional regulator